MEVPRNWRLQKIRYGLVGTEFSCGHKVFPPREICPVCNNKKESTLVKKTINKTEIFSGDSFLLRAVLAEEEV